MLLGFKRQFAPFVEDGSKQHTIRAVRKIAPRVGGTAHCYTGLRQKGARLLGRFAIVRIQQIHIGKIERSGVPLVIEIEGEQLSPDEANSFLWRNGFRDKGGETYESICQAADFWAGRLPFDGQIIHWYFQTNGSGK